MSEPAASLADRIDVACTAFERAWQREERPRIEDYLSDWQEAERAKLLSELLSLEVELRRQSGEEPTADEYLARFPDHAELVHNAFREINADEPQADPQRNQRFPIRLNCPHCKNPIAIVDDSADEEEVVCPSCGSSIHLDPDRTVTWSPDKLPQLGKFEMLEPVGRGAFGTVYKARDTELDRIVAVKVPRSGTFATQEDEDRDPQISKWRWRIPAENALQ